MINAEIFQGFRARGNQFISRVRVSDRAPHRNPEKAETSREIQQSACDVADVASQAKGPGEFRCGWRGVPLIGVVVEVERKQTERSLRRGKEQIKSKVCGCGKEG